jgi:serine/threonine-protein kinase
MSQLLGALEEAHSKRIVHRDLKPDNIMLVDRPGGRRTVKILDFGIAKFTEGEIVGPKTKTGTPMGTPWYMSPEQCLGKGVDHRADIYSVGVILYQMFTGRVPFSGTQFLSIINAHLSMRPYSPSMLVKIPEELEKVILWCLEKKRGDRPQDIATLRSALLPVLEQEDQAGARSRPVLVEGAELPELPELSQTTGLGGAHPADSSIGRPVWKRAVLVAAVAVVVLGGAAVVLFATGRSDSPRPEPAAVERRPPETPAATKPRKVLFQLHVEPRDVPHEVRVDGELQQQDYFKVERSEDRQIAIEVTAPGHKPWKVKRFPSVSDNLVVKLAKLPAEEPAAEEPAAGKKARKKTSGKRSRKRPRKRRAPKTPPSRTDDDVESVL